MNHPSRVSPDPKAPSRRAFLQDIGAGLGPLALACLLDADGLLTAAAPHAGSPGGEDLRPRPGHFPPQAKAVLMLMQIGGPSHPGPFDPKPAFQRSHGQLPPGAVAARRPR